MHSRSELNCERHCDLVSRFSRQFRRCESKPRQFLISILSGIQHRIHSLRWYGCFSITRLLARATSRLQSILNSPRHWDWRNHPTHRYSHGRGATDLTRRHRSRGEGAKAGVQRYGNPSDDAVSTRAHVQCVQLRESREHELRRLPVFRITDVSRNDSVWNSTGCCSVPVARAG